MTMMAATRTQQVGPRYKWLVLSNTTIGVVLASMNATSLIIALPVIFRGIRLNPLDPSNFPYLLWIIMGYMLVTAVLVVTVGRIGDIFGRVRMYNLGFALFTLGSVLLSLVWSHGSAGALELIFMRMFQAIGGTMLMANSAAIITDAFPSEELGLGLGINMVAAIFGSFFGILAGGLLSQAGWRWVFLVNVPVGLFGTVWAFLKLKEIGIHARAKIDWLGNVAFAGGLGMVLVGVTYGIKPYGHSLTGWADPFVLEMIFGGLALLIAFVVIELKVPEPMFRLSLFRIRAFTAGNIAQFLGAVGRGGMQFMLIIWFQGIWLPQHGYDFVRTPLWSGIYMLPFMAGFVLAGPISGKLSDRYGARPFATGGMVLSAGMYLAMMAFPPNFAYGPFAVVMLVSGIAMGLFAAPNTASIMNSVPARERGAASGMRVTFSNAGMPLSMGLFFTLMVFGLNAKVPAALTHGLAAHGVPAAAAAHLSHLPPLGYLFASFLGYNPLAKLLGPAVLSRLPAHQAALITGRSFFPQLIGAPFKHGLVLILAVAVVLSLIAAVASALRGTKFVHEEAGSTIGHGPRSAPAAAAAPVAGTAGDGASGGPAAVTVAGAGAGEPQAAAAQTAPLPAGRREAFAAHATGGPPGNRAGDGERTGAAADGAGQPGVTTGGQHQDQEGAAGPVVPAAPRTARLAAAGQGGPGPAAASGPSPPQGNGAALAGTVRGCGGDPLRQAVVTIMDGRGAQVARALTGDDGRFGIEGIGHGLCTALVSAPGHRPLATTVAPGGPGAASDFTLTGVGTLAGVVRQAAGGAPLAGASVTLTDASGQVVAQSVTGPDGGYRFPGLAEGAYTVVASGFHPVAIPLVLAAGEGRDLDLPLGQGRG